MPVPARLRRWLAPPRFEDAQTTRQAAVLHTVLLFLLAMIVTLVSISPLQPSSTFGSILLVYTPLTAVHLGALVLLRLGHVRLAGFLFVGVVWVVVTAVTWFFGGMTAQNASGYVVLVIVAAFVLGGHYGTGVAALSMLAAGCMVLAEARGVLPEPWIRLTPLDAWIGLTATLVMAAFLVQLGVGRFRQATERAERGERALRASVEALRATHRDHEARAVQGSALARLAQEVLRLRDVDAACERACALVAETLEAEHVAVLERDPGGAVRPRRARHAHGSQRSEGWSDPVSAHELSPLANVLAGRSGSTRHGGGEEHPALAPGGCALGHGVASGIPGRERIQGALVVAGLARGAPGAEEVAFVETVAGLLGAVIEHDQAEGRLRHAQKMDVVGQLAGGVAHDFNNLLTSILSSAELAARSLPPDRPEHPLLDEVRSAGELAALLTRQLLAFSRRQMLRTERLRVDEVLGRLEALLRRLIGDALEIRAGLDAGDATVECDRGNLEQVLLNLALNARDAAEGPGTLQIATRVEKLDEVPPDLLLEPGSYAVVTVRDDGRGMPEDVRQHIFEPFFSTKESTQGTGLGLFTVHGIVSAAGGDVRVRSAPKQGACFEVYLPCVEPVAAHEHAQDAAAPRVAGDGTLLLVEDDGRVRRIARRILEGAGYAIVEALDGREALEQVEQGLTPDLVVTDLVMPRLGGLELAAALATRGYRGPLLFMSGYAPDPAELARTPGGRVALLTKPFSPSGLLEQVGELLSEEAEG